MISVRFSAVGGVIAWIVIQLDLVMCWYSFPELVFPLYIIPMLIAGCFVHTVIAERYKVSQQSSLEYVLLLR